MGVGWNLATVLAITLAVYYNFQEDGIPMLHHSTSHSLNLNDPIGNTIPVQPKNIFQNLGHFISPAGIQTTQAKAILEIAHCISQALSKCPISCNAAYALYHSALSSSRI